MASWLQMPTLKALCLGHMQLELQVGQAMLVSDACQANQNAARTSRHAEQVRQQNTAGASLNEDTKPTGSRQFPTSSIT